MFWVIQTICLALYSEHGGAVMGRSVIAMICERMSLGFYMTLDADIRLFRPAVLYYAFCEYSSLPQGYMVRLLILDL